MINFTSRNIRIFFRDKTGVIYSLITIIIIIGLYALFLNDVVLVGFNAIENKREVISNWNMAGLLGIVPITSTMCSLQVMIDDRVNKTIKDLYSTPMAKWKLVAGYILNAMIISVTMSIFSLFFLEGYVFINCGAFHHPGILIQVLIMILISCFASSAFIFFIVSFFYSQNVFAIASTLIGILGGFLSGVFLPMGMMPKAVQTVIKLFPISHIAVMFRKIIMKDSLASLGNDELSVIRYHLGITYEVNGYVFSFMTSFLYIVIFTVIFFALGIFNVSRKKY